MSDSVTGQSTFAALSPAIYLVAFLMILQPPLDIALGFPVYALDNARWRFGAVGMLTGGLLMPLLGYLIVTATAVKLRHTWRYRLALAFGIVLVVAMLVLFGAFLLDAIQVRREVAPEMLRRFDVTVVKALIMQLVQTAVLLVILFTGHRARRETREDLIERQPAGMVFTNPSPTSV